MCLLKRYTAQTWLCSSSPQEIIDGEVSRLLRGTVSMLLWPLWLLLTYALVVNVMFMNLARGEYFVRMTRVQLVNVKHIVEGNLYA